MKMKENKTIIYPAGYKMEIQAWENDGDHTTNIAHWGLNYADVTFLIELLSLYSRESNYGNIYEWDFEDEDYKSYIFEVTRILKQHSGLTKLIPDDLNFDDAEDVDEFINDFTYSYMGGGEFATRRLEKITLSEHDEIKIVELGVYDSDLLKMLLAKQFA